jgi:hypothetical protein
LHRNRHARTVVFDNQLHAVSARARQSGDAHSAPAVESVGG